MAARRSPSPTRATPRADFFESLAHSSAVVGINTSALLEAAILGKPVLVPLVPQFAGTQQGTLRFRYLLHENGGFLHVAPNLDDHADQLAAALEQGDDQAAQTRRFVESFLRPRGLDRPAARFWRESSNVWRSSGRRLRGTRRARRRSGSR